MINIQKKWACSTKTKESASQRPPVVFGQLLLATFNYGMFKGTLLAIDIESGKEIWRFDRDHFLNEPSVTHADEILLTCFNGSIYKLNSKGKLLWQLQPSKFNTWAGIIVGNQYCYAEIAGQSKFTRAINIDDGSLVWEFENGGHSYALASDSEHCIVHASVAGSFESTAIFLYCINKNTGELIWKTQNPQYLFQPLIIGNVILIGSRGYVALFDLATGKLLNKFLIQEGVAVTSRPIQTDAGTIFATEKGQVFCVSIDDDVTESQIKELWRCDLAVDIVARPLVKAKDLYVITEAGNLVQLSCETGAVIQEKKIPNFVRGYGMTSYQDDLIIGVSNQCLRIAY